MTLRFYRRTLLVLSCAAAAAGPAHAGFTANSNLSDMRFSVADLAPDDGVEAGFRILPDMTNFVTHLTTDTLPWRSDSDRRPLGLPARAELSAPGLWTAAYTPGDAGTMTAQVSIDTDAIDLTASGYQAGYLELSPHSRLVVRGISTFEASWTPLAGAQEYYGRTGAYLWFSPDDAPSTTISHGIFLQGSNEPWEMRETMPYMQVFDNAGDTTLSVYFKFGVYAGGRVSAVPEPAGLPMLAAGLGLLAAWRRAKEAV